MKKTSDPDFDRFWEEYPQRVGKLKAEQAYAKAKKRATADEILAGVARYVRHKPEWQAWAHPSSWLHQGRWMDEYEPRRPILDAWSCPHADPCSHRAMCLAATILGRPEKGSKSA